MLQKRVARGPWKLQRVAFVRFLAPLGWENKQLQTKFGKYAEIMGLHLHAKFSPDQWQGDTQAWKIYSFIEIAAFREIFVAKC